MPTLPDASGRARCPRRAGAELEPSRTRRAARTFLAHASALARVRGFASATLAEWGLSAHLDDAMLGLSEIAANAVEYGLGGTITVVIERLGALLRLSVAQGLAAQIDAQAAMPGPGAESGRGLPICRALAAAGSLLVDTGSGGTTVSFCLQLAGDQA